MFLNLNQSWRMSLHICPSSFSSIKGADEKKLSFEWLGVKDNWRQSNMKKKISIFFLPFKLIFLYA
jgi:hypothetical protein